MSNKTEVLNTRYIVPFFFDQKKTKYDGLAAKGDSWIIEHFDSQERDVYGFIVDSFITDNNRNPYHINESACLYKYNGKLPVYCYFGDDMPDSIYVDIKIRSAGLILFQNGIGFLWYGVELNDPDHFVGFTNKAKELARSDDNRLKTERKYICSEGQTPPEGAVCVKDNIYKYYDTESRGVWIAELLKSLDCDIEFVPSRTHNGENIPDKAHVFNYAVFEDEQNIIDKVYRLTRGYNDNYRVPVDADQQMIRPFENVYVYASGEGCGYYTYKSEVNVDGRKIMNDYFMLYILTLYQNYSLLRFSKEIAEELPSDYGRYGEYSRPLYKKLKDMNTRINAFLSKDIYSSVSFVQHQNDYYNYLMDRLRIHDNFENIMSGIEALRDIQNSLEEDKRNKRERILNWLLALIAIFGILQTIASIPTIIEMFF